MLSLSCSVVQVRESIASWLLRNRRKHCCSEACLSATYIAKIDIQSADSLNERIYSWVRTSVLSSAGTLGPCCMPYLVTLVDLILAIRISIKTYHIVSFSLFPSQRSLDIAKVHHCRAL